MRPQQWLFFLVLFLIAGVFVRSTFVGALVTSVLVILGITYWWQKHSLDNVFYRRRFRYTRGFPGEHNQVRIEIENRKFLPLSWLRTQDPWPKQVGPEDEATLAPSHIEDQGFLTNLVSLRWYERTRRSFDLLLRQRGVYKVGPTKIESGDLFGIYQKERQEERLDTITVYPQLLSLREMGLPAEDPFGDRGSLRRLFEDPNRPIGVRDYHPEDGFRRVHWPATARTGTLQVKVYQPVSAQVMAICLNVATFVRHWEGYHPQLLEQLVSLAATLASQGIQEGYQVGLISNGCLANSDQPFRVPPGRSAQQLPHLLQSLAGVTPLVTASFNEFLLREAPRIPYGAILLVLTAIVTPELGETLVKLKRHERRITLISLAEEVPPTLPGIQAVHLPFRG